MPLTATDAKRAVVALEAQIAETQARIKEQPELAGRLDAMRNQRANFERFAAETGS